MQLKNISICFVTDKIKECSRFYEKHFSGKIIFDCGWYINLEIGNSRNMLQFMQPREEGGIFSGQGITLNFNVEDVDAEHRRLISSGIKIVMPLEDHSWGDRAFAIADPIGNLVYIYSEREPSAEYAQYYK